MYTKSHRRSGARLTAAGLLAALAAAAGGQTVIYVDLTASGGNNGMTWQDAYVDLQDALFEAAPGDEIWVAAETYTPAPPGEIQASFQLKSGVGVYGGFAGGELRRDDRDPLENVTILSGDLGRDDVYGNPWYVGWNINTQNAIHVVNGSGVDETAVLDGFTIKAGYATQNSGGGMYVLAGSPTLQGCTFTRNLAGFASGGGMYSYDANPTLRDCRFIQNYVHLGQGAGLFSGGSGAPLIERCHFAENIDVGTPSGGEGAGAAISHYASGELRVLDSAFVDNVARGLYPSGDRGGTYAGAIHQFGGTMTVERCLFLRNWSNCGGAIWTWRDATIVNSLFIRNQAPEYHASQGGWGGVGGAIGGLSYFGATITLLHCTIVDNSATEGGGLRLLQSASADVDNCIFWGNVDQNGSVGPSQIRGAGAGYSCIQNMLVPIPGEDPPDPRDFPGCIDANPMFVNQAAYDLHLLPGSPSIDAADNLAVPAWVTTDYDGLLRFFDDPATPDTGRGTPPIADMGACEFQFVTCDPCDANCDGAVDAFDIEPFIGLLVGGGTPCSVCAGDANGDGAIDAFDIEPFIACLLP